MHNPGIIRLKWIEEKKKGIEILIQKKERLPDLCLIREICKIDLSGS